MSTTEHHASFRSSWIWLAILGVISIAGGLLALANPSAATFAAVLLAAWTFLIFGVLQVIQAFQMRGWSGFWWSLAFGVLTFLVGLSLLVNPLAGALSLTVVVAVLFIVVGVVKLIYASRLRPMSGWGWGGCFRHPVDHPRHHDHRRISMVGCYHPRHPAGDRTPFERRLPAASGFRAEKALTIA